MEPDAPGGGDRVWIIGPGRLGLALGLALVHGGEIDSLVVSGRRTRTPDHPLFDGPSPLARYQVGVDLPPDADFILIAVPDAQISAVAASLAARARPASAGTVLHTSGAYGSEALRPLAAAGWSVGSIHPLVAVADAVEGAERLKGAWFAVEGDEVATAAAEELVRKLAGRTLTVDAGGKPLYHAAAVFASNYLVTLLATAERLAMEAGITQAAARSALSELARGALEAVAAKGPADALTGPISRGDDQTVALHLSRLSPPDAALYSVLARATLEVARSAGLNHHAIARIGRLLPETD